MAIVVYTEGVQELYVPDAISTPDKLALCSGHTVALDTETTGLNPWNDNLIGVGFYCPQAEVEGYIPTHTEEMRRNVREIISNFSVDTTFIFHNAKFDMHFLRMEPKKKNLRILDTTIMVHLLDSRNFKSLDWCERAFLGSESKREHVDGAPARKKIWEWPENIRAAYCRNDCRVTYQLAQKLFPLLEEWQLVELFWKDMEYTKTIYGIEDYGVLLDEVFVYESANKLQEHIDNMEEHLFDSCGNTFNWRSPQQLSRAIYDGLGIAKPKNPFLSADGIDHSRFADSGKYKSTCTSTFLLTEKVHHPLGDLISSMRECDKLRKNYLKWLELEDGNNILHTSFNQTGTRTGRLSSSRPNLQNIASKTRGRFTQSVYSGSVERTDEFNMRRAIVARPGSAFLSVDYKQMEMRMFGILSQDPFMLEALIAGKDVHLEIAHKVWGDCGHDMDMIHREWSKTITFGLIYGMTLGSLQYKLNMTRQQAAAITDGYWAEFPRIKPWMNEIVDSCKRDLYLRYWSGRIWREDNAIDMYKGCNALIQGGCADLLSIAAMRVDKFNDSLPDTHLVNLVHDETITEVPIGHLQPAIKNIAELMRVPDLLDIPFATEVKIGPSYGVLEKVGKELFDSSEELAILYSKIISDNIYEPKVTTDAEIVETELDLEDDEEGEEE